MHRYSMRCDSTATFNLEPIFLSQRATRTVQLVATEVQWRTHPYKLTRGERYYCIPVDSGILSSSNVPDLNSTKR